MSAVGPKADVGLCAAHVRFRGDCVAKVFAALRERNNRIRLNASLNQYCVSAFVLESMLLDLVVKIVLQHYRPESGHVQCTRRTSSCLQGHKQTFALQKVCPLYPRKRTRFRAAVILNRVLTYWPIMGRIS